MYAVFATLPFFVLGILMCANAAVEREDVSLTAETSAGETGDLEASSSIHGELPDITDEKMKIKEVMKEKDGESASTSSSSENEDEHNSTRNGILGNFTALLNGERSSALAELMKKEASFEVRKKDWHKKMASTTTEFKIKLSDENKARVESNLNVILARFVDIDAQMQNVSGKLANYISQTRAQTNLSLATSTMLLAEADAKLTLAKNDVAKAGTDIQTMLSTSTSKEELKADIQTVKESIKSAYTAYKDTIKSIRFETNGTASTSTSSSL
jgi:hypothetical protein